jgi:subtilisin family serine protease
MNLVFVRSVLSEVRLNNKFTLAILAAFSSSAFMAYSLSEKDGQTVQKQTVPSYLTAASFIYDPKDTTGLHLYVVHLADAPVALYEGGIEKYAATKPNNRKLQLDSPAVESYSGYLASKHDQFLSLLKKQVVNVEPTLAYKIAFNGLAIKLSQDQASAISRLPGVLKVVKDRIYKLDTDTGPSLIGAPAVWSGAAQDSGVGTYGEGVVVGIIDSGINTDHPSFSAVAGDGYVHINPFGSGVYLGDCAGDFSNLCNSKLIGVYSYPVITDEYADTDVFGIDLPRNGEDYGGHGSHVAGTAAGNILLNTPESLPELGAIESDGIATGFVFDRISGVAPRANIISYQVCWGGREDAGDTYGDCSGAAINAAIEDAIQDQVDIINYSISGGGQPWNSSTELAFLAAQNAGIFVATSAGNSGPSAGSTVKYAPWYTAVAASEHGRSISYQKQLTNFSGGNTNLSSLTGTSNSGGITAPIVYAGDFSNPNDPNNDPAQCLEAFPAGTFSGQIVVCDRGEIARVQKAVNVRDGGAGGYVLGNVVGGSDNLANDQYVVAGIHLQSAQASLLRNWLAFGSNHVATITASSGNIIINQQREDVLAGFSSKGPSNSISTLTPAIGGPGVQIYAAWADQQFGHDGHEPAAGDFSYLSGTSMSSPHVAGSAALIKAAQPAWTPDNIRSALAMTASRTVKKEDAVTNADWFDSGSGRVQVDKAVEAGLIMNETAANYAAADPNIGGEPRELNLPSITDNQCANTCVWSRTFTAAKSGTWSVNSETISPNIQITSTPASFSLNVGETQIITTIIDVTNASSSDWLFGAVTMTANGQPDLHLPVSVYPTAGSIPELLRITAGRLADSYLVKNIKSKTQTSFTATTLGFTKANEVNGEILQDSTPTFVFDDIQQGVNLFEFDVDSSHQRIVAQITQSSATDIDLFLVFDANGNGIPEDVEVVNSSTTSGSIEYIDTTELSLGKYWVMVQNYEAGIEGQADTYNLFYAAVNESTDDTSLSFSVPSSVSAGNAFDVRANWDLGDAQTDDKFYGIVVFGNAGAPDDSGVSLFNLTKGGQDVELRSAASFINIGENTEFHILVKGTSSPENRNYDITLPIPSGFSLDANSVGQGGAVSGNEVNWNITKQTAEVGNQIITFELIPTSTITEQDLRFSITSDVTNIQAAQVETSILSSVIQLDAPPTVTIDGSNNATAAVIETQTINITAVAVEPNGEAITFTWRQVDGPSGTLTNTTSATVGFTAPSVEGPQVATLEVSVQDPQGNIDTARVTVSIGNNEAPTITVSSPTSVTVGQSYTVSVTSSDPENDSVSVTIDGRNGTVLTRNAPSSPTTLRFDVVASDGINQVSQSVSITVTAVPSSNSGGGSMGAFIFLLVPILFFRRLFRLGRKNNR